MDNSQYYQPLSHALHPPVSSNNRSPQYQSYNSHATSASHPSNGAAAAAEDDEEEEEDVVEEELAGTTRRSAVASNPASPEVAARQTGQIPNANATTSQQPAAQQQAQVQPVEPPKPVPDPSTYAKRRPGRPKGSKTKKPPQTDTQVPTYAPYYAYQSQVHALPHTSAASPLHTSAAPPHHTSAAPPHHPDVNEQNRQYYEFQWRVLNLCGEFYAAAEELVKGTPPLVLAQCYGLGTASPVDPLTILSEAKRNCDLLLANPSALITHPPPPMYPVMPVYSSYQPAPVITPTSASTATSQVPPPLAAAPAGNPSTSVPAASNSSRYPTAPYYQYTGAYQSAPQATYYSTSTTGSTSATIANPSLSAGAGGGPATGGNSGTWSDEETERLKKLAEQSKSTGASGEIEWDWVINQWGNSRTRHQILIKATNLGLKESSGRGVKRRRETDSGAGGTASPAPPAATSSIVDTSMATPTGPPASSTSTFQVSAQPAPSASPAASTPASTQPSPALHHPQPQAQTSSSSAATHNLPWPMPTVASTTSPVITATEVPRTSYYRPRPNQSPALSNAKPPSGAGTGVTHQYMYQPNGGQRK